MFDALVKVGGSLCTQAALRSSATAWAALATEYRLLVLPGGGPFADQVRAVDTHFRLSDSAAHWMAILAMDQYGYLLADVIPGAILVRDLSAAADACAAGRLPVLAPSALLVRADPLPHSWQVTSDSLAAWLAEYTDIRLLVLLKAVAGVCRDDPQTGLATVLQEIPRHALAHCRVVDPYFVQALSPHTDCWIIDGRHPKRLAELLRCGTTLGTRVV
ncbi:MAG: hypothetical protein Q9O62_04600 [Ardenticatenia bacterium]|nr:hypothetical protein [Ardenticatenia bacterium]